MLALVLTLILAVYILGPDVLLRVIVGLFAPPRTTSRPQGEEVARAFIVAALPMILTFLVSHFLFGRFNNVSILKDFMLGLYGEKSLEDHHDAFFSAAGKIIQLNLEFLLLPVYLSVILASVWLIHLIRRYGQLLRRYRDAPVRRAMLSWLVRPWAAEWHLKLSGALLPKDTDLIRVDILTKLDVLFRGTLLEHHLAADGSLISLTLASPQKFHRKELLEARASKSRKAIDPAEYWSAPIETNSFVIMASEIVTLNINYVDPDSLAKMPSKVTKAGAGKALSALTAAAQRKSSGKSVGAARPAQGLSRKKVLREPSA